MYSRLLSLDKDDQLLPLLAAEWDVTRDGKVYTFKLRPGVRFHDGKPLTAEDVVYSFNMIIDPPRGIISRHKGVFAPVIEKAESPDSMTVRITTKRPVGWLLTHLALVQIAPKHAHTPVAAQGGFNSTAVGTGPFKLKTYTKGVELRTVRNEDYFKKEFPFLDELRWPVIADEEAFIAAFLTGRVHHSGTRDVSQETLDAIKGRRPGTIERFERPLFLGVAFNLNNPRVARKRVREALTLALDQETVNELGYPGVQKIGSWFPGRFGIPPEERKNFAMFGYGKSRDERLKTARQIVTEEGMTETGLNFQTYTGVRREAEVMQELVGRAGLKLNLKLTDFAAHQKTASQGDFDLLYTWTGLTPFGEPEHFIAALWTKDAPIGQGGRPAGYSNPKIEELFAQLQSTVDIEKRVDLTRQIDRVLLDDMPATLIGWRLGQEFLDPRVRGYVGKEAFHPVRMMESVWLAAN